MSGVPPMGMDSTGAFPGQTQVSMVAVAEDRDRGHSEVRRGPMWFWFRYGFGPENVGLMFPMK